MLCHYFIASAQGTESSPNNITHDSLHCGPTCSINAHFPFLKKKYPEVEEINKSWDETVSCPVLLLPAPHFSTTSTSQQEKLWWTGEKRLD